MPSLTIVKVGTDKLKIGMYVTSLDRPWLETPFMFQGFAIRDNSEIDQLCSHCKYVHIDTEKGDSPRPERYYLRRSACRL